MKIYFLVILFFSSVFCRAQINVVPMPAEIKTDSAMTSFVLSPSSIIFLSNDPSYKTAELLNTYLKEKYGFTLKITTDKKYRNEKNVITISKRLFKAPVKNYLLGIKDSSIFLQSNTDERLFYGLQTLFQLLPNKAQTSTLKNYPLSGHQLSIDDYPRFSYRGMHLDVSRHFFTVAEVKKYIDYLAYYKFNNFHWHLTDDQGWRIEIKKYPLLTQIGSCRAQTLIGNYGSNKYDGKKYCGYYTQDEIREVVKYAKDRYINIIPEIEMPGHALAALASYPYLGCTKGPYRLMETWGVSDEIFCAGNDSTFQFIKNVLDEVNTLFPSSTIHIGGDECPKERWKACPVCQQKIKELGLKDEAGLQTWFTNKVNLYMQSKGKKLMGWDEVLEHGLSNDVTIMSWRGEEGGIAAAKSGHDAVMTPGSHCYFDHSQSMNEDSITFGGYLPLEKVYSYEPVPSSLYADEALHIKGAQANLWTEYITNFSKIEYMIFPRMAAMAEVLWTPKDIRNWKDFERRLPAVFDDYKRRNINYSKAYYDLSAIPVTGKDQISWLLETRDHSAKIMYSINGSGDLVYSKPVNISKSGRYSAYLVDAAGKQISNKIIQQFSLNKATGKKITLTSSPASAYAGLGGFTLVDGIENTMGMAKSAEFLGFSGTDLEAIIDLGEMTDLSRAEIKTFSQPASWIYPPASVGIELSDDGTVFSAPHATTDNLNGTYSISFTPTRSRFIRFTAKNAGTIPSDNPGAGSPAWLFVDEIRAF